MTTNVHVLEIIEKMQINQDLIDSDLCGNYSDDHYSDQYDDHYSDHYDDYADND